MIKQTVSLVLSQLSMLSTLENAMSNCRVRFAAEYGNLTGLPDSAVQLSQIRISQVPLIEASLALRTALAAAAPHGLGPGAKGLIAQCQALHEPTLQLRLREISLLGAGLKNVELTLYSQAGESKHNLLKWATLNFNAEEIASELAEIRAGKQYRYTWELAVCERTLQRQLTEYSERDLPLKKFSCAYHGGDRNWQPVVIEAKDQYRARILAIASWLGVPSDQVGMNCEWEMRNTSMTDVPAAEAAATV